MKINTAAELFDYFKGKWSIKRTLEFFGECPGRASFVLNGQTLNYSEEVQISRQGFEPRATQEYIFDLTKGSLHKKFKGGETFYTMEIEGNKATGKHLCKNDTYHATYQFNSQNSFSMTYQVVTGLGVKKYADIVTEFTREADLEASVLGVAEQG